MHAVVDQYWPPSLKNSGISEHFTTLPVHALAPEFALNLATLCIHKSRITGKWGVNGYVSMRPLDSTRGCLREACEQLRLALHVAG